MRMPSRPAAATRIIATRPMVAPQTILTQSGASGVSGEMPCVESALMAETLLSARSEEHTSELQSLMRISYAVFCLKKKKNIQLNNTDRNTNRIKLMTHTTTIAHKVL